MHKGTKRNTQVFPLEKHRQNSNRYYSQQQKTTKCQESPHTIDWSTSEPANEITPANDSSAIPEIALNVTYQYNEHRKMTNLLFLGKRNYATSIAYF